MKDRSYEKTGRKEHKFGRDHDGVKDVEIIQLLYKNMTCLYVDVVLEKLQFPWDLGKINR